MAKHMHATKAPKAKGGDIVITVASPTPRSALASQAARRTGSGVHQDRRMGRQNTRGARFRKEMRTQD